MLLRNLTRMHKLLLIVRSYLLFITPILYPLLSIPALLFYQALLAGLLGIIGGIDSCSIILNSTQLFSISTRIRESPGNIVVKDIKSTSPFRPRLLKLAMEDYPKDRKAYLNVTTTSGTHTPITRTEGVRLYTVGFIICLQNFLIGFLVL